MPCPSTSYTILIQITQKKASKIELFLNTSNTFLYIIEYVLANRGYQCQRLSWAVGPNHP